MQNVNTARATVAQARAQLALAEKAVADVAVVAPFSGYISQRRVSLGEYVQPSTAVVTLLKIDPLRLQLTIPGVQAGLIRVGQTVRATVDAFPEQTFTGRITRGEPGDLGGIPILPGRGARSRIPMPSSSPACSPSRRSIRAGR